MEYLNVGGQIDPMQIEQRRKMAERYGEMANTKPTGLLSAFANVASSYKQRKEEDAIAEMEGQQRAKLAEALAGGNQQLANIYANLPRERLAEAYMQKLQPKEAMTLKSGETLFDPNTNQPVYTNRGVEKPTILSPGQTVLGRDMQPQYTAPAAEQGITPYQQAQLDLKRQQIESAQQLSPTEQIKVKEAEEKQKKGAVLKDTARRLIDDLLQNPDAVKSVVGPFDSMTPTLRSSSGDTEAKIGQLRSILTAENLGLMTGVLSETDLKVIADIAGGGLVTTRGDEGFLKELERLRESLASEGATAPQTQPETIDSLAPDEIEFLKSQGLM